MNKDQRKQFLSSMLKTNQNNSYKQPIGRAKPMMGGPMNPGMMGGPHNMMGNKQMMGGPMNPGMMPNKGMMGMNPGMMGMNPGMMMGNKMGNMPTMPMNMQGMQPNMGGMQPNMQKMQGVKNMPMNMNQGGMQQPMRPNMGGMPNMGQQQMGNPSLQQKPQNQDWKTKKDAFSKKHYDSLQSQQDKCQYLGEIFWPYVAMKDPDLKRKITGFMIWNFDHNDLISAIHDEKKLEEIFNKSKKTVQTTK